MLWLAVGVWFNGAESGEAERKLWAGKNYQYPAPPHLAAGEQLEEEWNIWRLGSGRLATISFTTQAGCVGLATTRLQIAKCEVQIAKRGCGVTKVRCPLDRFYNSPLTTHHRPLTCYYYYLDDCLNVAQTLAEKGVATNRVFQNGLVGLIVGVRVVVPRLRFGFVYGWRVGLVCGARTG
jgi:hypothetical protein